MSSSDQVRQYFDRTATSFDSIYREDRSAGRSLRDRFRGTVTKRLHWVETYAESNGIRSVLDVGCGSGRFGNALARRGIRSHGIDFAPQMIELATTLALEEGLEKLATFSATDFNTWLTRRDESFDLGIAMGVFDYVEDPVPCLTGMADACSGSIAVSFPRRMHALTPIRVAKFKLANCPLFLYSRKQVEDLARAAKLRDWRILKFSRDYLLVTSICNSS